ncbi:hypothetical protein [Epibacterium sp. Ofav1-8]|uniref:hypothetical protein n=1 Tax=Epibacterium sp. Ofav1-8 TaxID=2917735 RepID=UPI001EF5AEED|nr:hypothetical protein [Epibacterium sp. Ofav1-8]MCG7624825.1 hypothetical protein [Epibacterium sp. Ofav1-8]
MLVALPSLQDNAEKSINDNGVRPEAVQLRFLHPGYLVGAFNEFEASGWFNGLFGSFVVEKNDVKSYAVFSAAAGDTDGPHLIAVRQDDGIRAYLRAILRGKQSLPAQVRIRGFVTAREYYDFEIKRDLRRKGHVLRGRIYYVEVFTDRRGRTLAFLWGREVGLLGFSVVTLFVGFVLIRSERETAR